MPNYPYKVFIPAIASAKKSKGRRKFALTAYELLPLPTLIPQNKYRVKITFHYTESQMRDIDNSLKITIDVLKKRVIHDDWGIKKLEVEIRERSGIYGTLIEVDKI